MQRCESCGPLSRLVFVECGEEAVNVLSQHEVGCREPQLGGFTAADADFLLSPEPSLERRALDGGNVDGGNGAPHGRVRRRPGLRAALLHLFQNIVSHQPVTPLDSLHSDVVGELDCRAQPA
jgi:hypothetical protein